MNNAVFGKTMENLRKHGNINLTATEKRRSYLTSEPSYHATKILAENLLATEMRKTQMLMKNSVCLSILDLSKTVMYEFWYDYVKSNMLKMENFVIWIQTASLFMQEQMIFTKILQKILKENLTHQTLKQTDHYLKEKLKR